MSKLNKRGGFTLAELLIVIAIIAILVAIAIPVFSAQLENARRQADHANLRSAYALVQTANILGADGGDTISGSGVEADALYYTDGQFHKTAPASGTAVTIKGDHSKGTDPGCAECVVPCNGFSATSKIKVAEGADANGNKVYSLTAG